MAITSSNGFKILKEVLSGIYELSDNSTNTKIIIDLNYVLFVEFLNNKTTKIKHIENKNKDVLAAISSVINLSEKLFYIEIELEKDSAVTIETKGYAQFKE